MFNILGLEEIILNIDKLINNQQLPHFICIEGNKFSGKTLLSKYIANKLNCPYINVNNIEDVRTMIDECFNSTFNKTYIIEDFNSLNFRASEAMLKIMEEAPKGSYIIINTKNSSLIKNTIKNRSFFIKIDNYNINLLKDYLKDLNINLYDYFETNNFYTIFNNIGLLKYINEDNRFESYFEFCDKFLRAMTNVSGGNSLKSLEYISTKKDDNKIDIELFLKIIYKQLLEHMRITLDISLVQLLELTNDTLRRIQQNPYINLDNVYISFILEYRRRSKKIGFTGIKE